MPPAIDPDVRSTEEEVRAARARAASDAARVRTERPSPPPERGSAVAAIAKSLVVSALAEVHAVATRVLVRAAILIFVLATGVIVVVAGVFRLAEALAMACSRLFGDPVLGMAVSGLALVAIPVLALWVLSRLWRK